MVQPTPCLIMRIPMYESTIPKAWGHNWFLLRIVLIISYDYIHDIRGRHAAWWQTYNSYSGYLWLLVSNMDVESTKCICLTNHQWGVNQLSHDVWPSEVWPKRRLIWCQEQYIFIHMSLCMSILGQDICISFMQTRNTPYTIFKTCMFMFVYIYIYIYMSVCNVM
jgi:hypothetical protein